MRVYIIGAGPGAPDLVTVRGAELIARCPIVLYTGSLVPRELLARARQDATVLDSSSMTLEQIIAVLEDARARDLDVARVHTGDPSIFGSTAEQMRRMDQLGIAYEVVPGVSSFTAAAAALGRELTLPELSQTVILTRAEGRTPMPERERLEALAAHGATLCLFLSITLLREVIPALIPAYGEDCPVAIVHRASWPDQVIVQGTLADIRERARAAGLKAQSMILVGRVLTANDFANSKLYDPDFSHRFRRANAKVSGAEATRGLLVVYTGQGKGKTTAALGMVMRALGRGMRVTVVQFIKGKWTTGERLFAREVPGLRFLVMGQGFTWQSDDLSRDQQAARAAWSEALVAMTSGEQALVVMDELTYAIHYGFVTLEEVCSALRARPPHVHVVITGRHAPAELLDMADIVTDMVQVKHVFTTGQKAQRGVDF